MSVNRAYRNICFSVVAAVVVVAIVRSFYSKSFDPAGLDAVDPTDGLTRETSISPFSLDSRTPIVFSLVMFGKESAEEGRETIKSILYHSSRPVDIHIICSEDAEPVLRARLDLVNSPKRPVRVYYYIFKVGQGLSRTRRAGISTKHHAGEGGLTKILIHEILPPHVTHAIYLDTDALFATDPALLWADFEHMEDELVSFPTVGQSSQAHTICSCTLLLPLHRQRKAMMVRSDLLPNATFLDVDLSQFARDENGFYLPAFGDQGFYYALWQKHPNLVKEMSIVWDVGGCNGGRGIFGGGEDMTPEQQLARQHHDGSGKDESGPWWETGQQLWPGIIHYNCVAFEGNIWHGQDTEKFWGVFPEYIKYMTSYKWIHLNQHSHHASDESRPQVLQHTYRDIEYMDELMARGAYPSIE